MTCEVCDKDIESYPAKALRCTNRRCGDCHARYCTDGGSTGPGHGRGNPPKVEARVVTVKDAWGVERVVGGFGTLRP